MKKKMLISFSGGETSGYMLWWLLTHKSEEYDFVIVFANTGRENDETLDFVNECAKAFGINIIWVESLVAGSVKLGTNHKIVTYETATRWQDWKTRGDTPYELMIRKYGIPNVEHRISTRELKDRPITSYIRSIGWKSNTYETAIGIRIDEIDRMSAGAQKRSFIYPLIQWRPMTKKHINFWWSQQLFRLRLKGYQGNCRDCFKKSDNKLYQIALEAPEVFEFPAYMEIKYQYRISKSRKDKAIKEGREIKMPFRFYRKNKSVADILAGAQSLDKKILDDSLEGEENESCEVFTECGR